MKAELISKMFDQHFAGQYHIVSGEPRGIGHGRKFETTLAKVSSSLQTIDPSISLADVRTHIMNELPDAEYHGAGCQDLQKALKEFLKEQKIIVTPERILHGKTKLPLTPQAIQSRISTFCWDKNQYLAKEDQKYPKAELFDAFKTYQDELGQSKLKELQSTLRYKKNPTIQKVMGTLLKAVGAAETASERKRNATMLAHWMWTVKRRALLQDYRPSLPLMLVLSGPQGCGKSSFLETFLTLPLAGRVLNSKLDVIHDVREIGKFTQNIVVNFDELSTSDHKADTAEVLKNLITLESVQSRVFHTTDQQTVDILSTFAATTNKHLSEVVRDETGARRYWVIETKGVDGSQFDWETLEGIDWVALWQGIDENRKTGYFSSNSKCYEEIGDIQDTFCISPIVRDWLEESYVLPDHTHDEYLSMTKLAFNKIPVQDKPAGLTVISRGAFYEDYTQDMKAREAKYVCNPIAFHRMMEKLGVRTIIESPKHKKLEHYMLLKPDASHGDEDDHTQIG